jgi:hypothetical protein
MRFKSLDQLPKEHRCLTCKATNPIAEMIVIRERRTGHILLRSRCKECHNKSERGSRREYKTKYLRRWRARNPELNESYWRQAHADNREAYNARQYQHFKKNHAAVLIQGRLCRKGMNVTLREAKKLLRKFGRCYPTRYGLTAKGLAECERIRGSMRRGSEYLPSFEIRMMVYEDGIDKDGDDNFVIPPAEQPRPYQSRARRLRLYQKKRRLETLRRAA